MIVEYSKNYDEDIKDLLLELQEYIESIDKEGFNIVGENYREQYFIDTMNEVNNYEGKMLLYLDNNKVVGLVVGLINNLEEDKYDFKAPKRGRITELVVSKNIRSNGIGSKLLHAMEDYLHSVGCENILLGVFGYNDRAINFYEKNGYHVRMIDMIK